MPDEIQLLRRFRDETPGPSTDAWNRARAAIATATQAEAAATSAVRTSSPRPPRQRAHRRRTAALIAASLALVGSAAAAVAMVVGSAPPLTGPVTTAWAPARPLPALEVRSSAPATPGSWRLMAFITRQGWTRSTAGPLPGLMTCPSARVCFVIGDDATSPSGPAHDGSLYVSYDGARDWNVLPVPSAVTFSTALACTSDSDCAAGVFYEGQPAYLSTSNGGHSFTIAPLPAGDGSLSRLACPSSSYCAGLAATSSDLYGGPIDATFLVTTDGGTTFVSRPFPAGYSMTALACPAPAECHAVGTPDADRTGITAHAEFGTTDGGQTWVAGGIPTGFGTSMDLAQLSCASYKNCELTGNIYMPLVNPPGCDPADAGSASAASAILNRAAPSVRHVADFEASAARADYARYYRGSNAAYCTVATDPGTPAVQVVGDVATTSDGGRTWVPDFLPAAAPLPMLADIACPTSSDCYASGTAAIPQTIGKAWNGGQSVIFATHDAGRHWTMQTFAAPTHLPAGFRADAFMSVGSIQCPLADTCFALGVSDQGSGGAAVYSSDTELGVG